MTDHDRRKIINPATEVCLATAGLLGHALAESVDVDGSRQLWIVNRVQLDVAADCRDVDHGNESPEHELDGPLPAELVERIRNAPIRCGAVCADGTRCEIRVRSGRHRCGWHRRASTTERTDR